MSPEVYQDWNGADEIEYPEFCTSCKTHSLLSSTEELKLSFAAKFNKTSASDTSIEQMLKFGRITRLRSQILEMALAGEILPVIIRESGEVLWRSNETCLSVNEYIAYRAELDWGSNNTDESDSNDPLSSSERNRLRAATLASLGREENPSNLAEIVIRWSESVRLLEKDLEAVLAGRLIPLIPTDSDGFIMFAEVERLEQDRRAKYQHLFAELGTILSLL